MKRIRKKKEIPKPKHAESVVYIDNATKIPVMELDDMEKRALGLHPDTKRKRSKKRKSETNRYNFIEKDPTRATIIFSHLKTCLCYNMSVENAIVQCWISRWQYYKYKEDEEVANIFTKRENAHQNISSIQVNLAVRAWKTKVAIHELAKRDKRYQEFNDQALAQNNQMVNIFLNVTEETKHLLMKKYAWLPNNNSPQNNNEKSTWWSTQPEARWFLSPSS